MRAQRRYKTNIDKKVRQILNYDNRDVVYVQDDSSIRDSNPTHKLRPKTSGPLLVVVVTPKSVTIKKDGINDTVSINGVSIARLKYKNGSTPDSKTQD